MDFNYVEELVYRGKNGDQLSKEKLALEFKPLIINISKRTFIDGYEIYDLHNECYKSLFKCLKLYNLEKHSFVAYATNAIKNNMNDLIKRTKTKSSTDGNDALSLHDDVEKDLPSNDIDFEYLLCNECDYIDLRFALNNLTEEEKELIDFIFFKDNTIQTYAYIKNMAYSTASLKKKVTLKKLFCYINQINNNPQIKGLQG
ncbi:sigma-70 family RNA polymerase sigma factor [Clostridium chromiireducens]|uniref:Sigma-70 family RNA polymerase sigma factor n=1 Tax=Clostridium chromiireducens TaxID=225345 RepID=A0A399IR49_9CLOT|nr:sigma-70 family RNA polymerase sigma factor [Clostridium chromiireducens]RII35524.1 sigma-70 family RNA polymerase sigma factor [Clostridium chromiireducens]